MAELNVQERLRQLRNTYAGQLPGKIRQIELDCRDLLGGEFDVDLAGRVLQAAHTLKGSAASFGFTKVSSAAQSLEKEMKALCGDAGGADEGARARLGSCLETLIAAFAEPDNGPGEDVASEHVSSPGETFTAAGEKKVVFLAEDDPLLLENLSLQIGHFGYDVKGFTGLSVLAEALGRTVPDAIIMDMMFPEGGLAGAEAVAEIQSKRETPLPVIFISSRSDFDARLRAVRAGGDAYFVKPVNINGLIDKLDGLTTRNIEEPYRILIIDDDFELASYYSLVLQQAGMSTEVVNEPMKVMAHISRFNPDLILMDMYMPDCNGLELSKVIRQMDTYVSIPIVFLSAETSIDKQMSAMSTGGDDFLTKPIQREHLISSVTMRAGRMRIIRSFMDCDSLTGLLNHTKTKEQLDIAVERAKRQNGSLAFAMIDIDKFKTINDTYGHPTGDRVIISLSRLLQQRLRKTDVVGRYGGEEFAVVLNDTGADYAFSVLDGIRTSFSRIRHEAEGREFSASFSCGIAVFPDHQGAGDINDAADKALYEAKNGGRNRTVIAEK